MHEKEKAMRYNGAMALTRSSENQIHLLFEASIISKGIFAVLDLLGATLLYIFGPHAISRTIVMFSHGELIEDPHNSIAQLVLRIMNIPHPHITTFAIFYLFVHGTINAIFVIGLLREKLWAYRFAIVAMGIFLCYQAYRLIALPSPWMILLTTFDLGIIILVIHEYKLRKKQKEK
jgi:uncharacterized membrane protein